MRFKKNKRKDHGRTEEKLFFILSIIYKFLFSSGQRESSAFHKQLKTDTVSTNNSVKTNMEL